MSKSVNDVLDGYAQSNIGIRIAPLDQDTILVEGNAETLRFLGELLLAMSKSDNCGFQFGPQGAGRYFFARGSAYGLYIHNLDVCHDPDRTGNAV